MKGIDNMVMTILFILLVCAAPEIILILGLLLIGAITDLIGNIEAYFSRR